MTGFASTLTDQNWIARMYACASACVYEGTHVRACEGQIGESFGCPWVPFFFPASLQASVCLCLPGVGTRSVSHSTQLFTLVWPLAIEPGSSCLQGNYFADCLTSLACQGNVEDSLKMATQ